jgi:hypothetical protein
MLVVTISNTVYYLLSLHSINFFIDRIISGSLAYKVASATKSSCAYATNITTQP